MVPPLEEPPDGEWHCPACATNVPQDVHMPDEQYPPHEEIHQSSSDAAREASVASTSRSVVDVPVAVQRRGRKKVNGKGKARAAPAQVVANDSDAEEAGEVEEPETPMMRPRGRPRKSAAKLKTSLPSSSDEQEPDQRASSPVRPAKRRRAPPRPREVTPPPAALPRVRLRLPAHRAGGKGKEREEEEPHGLFDDILSVDERDTTKTTITNSDKVYFERSRITAEVRVGLEFGSDDGF